jgi:hypothetical protein
MEEEMLREEANNNLASDSQIMSNNNQDADKKQMDADKESND